VGSVALASVGTKGPDRSPLLGHAAVWKPSQAGALQLVLRDGRRTLADERGRMIQLRGMSTHGLQWFPQILNDNAFAALAEDWGANVVRLAMYVGEGGYASDPDKFRQRVMRGIDLAIAHDLYVIVDWHVLTPGDPRAGVYGGAMEFFRSVSARYPNDPHLLYELANEPNGGSADGQPGIPNDADGWKAVKAYAQPIVDMLRETGNGNIVIVGSPNWSQRPDLAADDPIDDPLNRTMYAFHFYAGSHRFSADSGDRQNVMSNVRYALERGAAVFATEWGTSEASGNGGPYLEAADAWLSFLNENNISWTNWSLANKDETSAALRPFTLGGLPSAPLDPGDGRAWTPEELSVSGEYVRARIKGIPYKPIDRRAPGALRPLG
jgi:endoglucanase